MEAKINKKKKKKKRNKVPSPFKLAPVHYDFFKFSLTQISR